MEVRGNQLYQQEPEVQDSVPVKGKDPNQDPPNVRFHVDWL